MAARFVLAQLLVSAVVALACLPWGMRAALAAACGGGTIAAGNAVFAWRMYGAGIAPARQQLLAVYGAAALKWLVVGGLLFWAIAIMHLPFPALIAGVGAAQLTFWLGLYGFR